MADSFRAVAHVGGYGVCPSRLPMAAALQMASTLTGMSLGSDDFEDTGKRVLTVERMFDKRAGFTSRDDRLPAFMAEQPLALLNLTFGVTAAELVTVFEARMAEQMDLSD